MFEMHYPHEIQDMKIQLVAAACMHYVELIIQIRNYKIIWFEADLSCFSTSSLSTNN